jgi:hypothetical protein
MTMEFKSLGAFGAHLLALHARDKIVEHEALEAACVQIENRAKEKFGEYQAQAGQFDAWAPLAESTIDDRISKGYTPDDPLLRSGETRDSIEHKVVGNEGHVGSDSDILMWLELGTEKMPPRSTLGGAAFEEAPKIAEEIGMEFVSYLSGGHRRIKV